MIPEIGQALLLLALLLALIQAYPSPRATKAVVLAVWGTIAAAFGLLVFAHVVSDFSVSNVAEYSHSIKPMIYKITGVWGNHEGSMLLLVLILATYTAVFTLISKVPTHLKEKIIQIQGLLLFGFLAFIVFTSNPFIRMSPIPMEGSGLNPLLQDIGLAIHPPMLYSGYIGFSLVFSFAIAGLLTDSIDRAWALALRRWTLASWSFLTFGVGLGSWWAYRELGWGGFWFWDPVENVSIMPWLAGTALVHVLLVLNKREAVKAWVVMLAILSFVLSLIGIFLVRSGVLTSVHAFAHDPARGVFILIFLAAVLGISLTIFISRLPKLEPKDGFMPVSRDTALLLGSVLFATACAVVVLGTLYPLAMQVLQGVQVSVGAPYFNTTFVLVALPILLLTPFGPILKWQNDRFSRAKKELPVPAAMTLLVAVALWLYTPSISLKTFVAIVCAAWLAAATLTTWWRKLGEGSVWERLKHATEKSATFYGMIIAHLGVAVLVIGIASTCEWAKEKETIITEKETVNFEQYHITLNHMYITTGENYLTRTGDFQVVDDAGNMALLKPEVRFYPVEQSNTTEAAIAYGLFSNFYIAMGETNGEGGYAIRLYIKPFMNVIWFGVVMMVLGGLIPLTGKPKKLT